MDDIRVGDLTVAYEDRTYVHEDNWNQAREHLDRVPGVRLDLELRDPTPTLGSLTFGSSSSPAGSWPDFFYECDDFTTVCGPMSFRDRGEEVVRTVVAPSDPRPGSRICLYATATRLLPTAGEPQPIIVAWHRDLYWRARLVRVIGGPDHLGYPFAVSPKVTMTTYGLHQARRIATALAACGDSWPFPFLLRLWAVMTEYPTEGALRQMVEKAEQLQRPEAADLLGSLKRILGRGQHPYVANPPGRAARNLLTSVLRCWIEMPDCDPPWVIRAQPKQLSQLRVALAEFGIDRPNLIFGASDRKLLDEALAIIWLQKVKGWSAAAPLLVSHGTATVADVLASLRQRVPRERTLPQTDRDNWPGSLLQANSETAWQVG